MALLDPISTINNVEFFLAKVARYSFDKSEVHLILLQRLESEQNMINKIVDFSGRRCVESQHQGL